MQYFGIQFLNQFKCAQGDCPQTCCKGWRILIDANTMEQIEKEPEDKRRELKRHIAGVRKGQPQIRKNFGRCPYHTKEQLCGLQLKKRTDLMPRVCREYPRRTVSFSSFAEITMELACPVVAQLFLEEKEMFSMQPIYGQEYEVLWKIGNEDPAFLAWLQQLREVLVKEAQQVAIFDAFFLQRQYVCVDAIHEMLMRNKLNDAKQILEKYEQDVWEEHRPEDTKRTFFSMEMVDKVIAHLLDTPNLAINNPKLKNVIKAYYHQYNAKTAGEAEQMLETTWEQMEQELPGTYEKYRKYYIYYLYEMLLCAYEDYHLLKVMLLGNMYLELYMVLDAVCFTSCKQKNKPYDMARQAELLAALERRMRHNTSVGDGILERLRKDFL